MALPRDMICQMCSHEYPVWDPDGCPRCRRLARAAQGIEARQRQDAKRLDPKDESPVSEGNAP